MNVRLTPHAAPQRTDLYGGIRHVHSDGVTLELYQRAGAMHTDRVIDVPLREVALIQLDEEHGDWF